MKKMLFMMLVVASIASFTSCSNDEEDANPMIGTKWTAVAYSNKVYVIEFYSNYEFRNYTTDQNGNIESNNSSDIDRGTYYYENGIISFTSHSTSAAFKSAIVDGRFMTLTYKSGYIRDFIKK